MAQTAAVAICAVRRALTVVDKRMNADDLVARARRDAEGLARRGFRGVTTTRTEAQVARDTEPK